MSEAKNPNEVIVQKLDDGKWAMKITVGTHTQIADEPIIVGGNDFGPSPYDYLLASLGSCTAITLRMYADHKQIPLVDTIVRLTYEKVYLEDCKNCEDKNSRLDHIERRIELVGNLTVEQRDKLLEIANRCPVHRTLQSKIDITTELGS